MLQLFIVVLLSLVGIGAAALFIEGLVEALYLLTGGKPSVREMEVTWSIWERKL